jgi:oxaloacetate decarboxylase alpha subunit
MDAKDRLPEVYEEIGRVRADAGYVPLVTPIAQVIGTQALRNVIDGERYKTVTPDFRALIGGKYGRLPSPVEPMFLKQILGDEHPISYRPADKLENEVEKYRNLVAPYAEQDEDFLTLAMFEDVAKHYFEERKRQKYHLDSAASSHFAVHPV